MATNDGDSETDRQGIADIFADFYKQLYRRCAETDEPTDAQPHGAHNNARHHAHHGIPQFTLEELHHAITQLKNGKCKDIAGITAELLKAGGDVIESHLLK
eukprot:7532976-Pyramimonas_sp.AAC.1